MFVPDAQILVGTCAGCGKPVFYKPVQMKAASFTVTGAMLDGYFCGFSYDSEGLAYARVYHPQCGPGS